MVSQVNKVDPGVLYTKTSHSQGNSYFQINTYFIVPSFCESNVNDGSLKRPLTNLTNNSSDA